MRKITTYFSLLIIILLSITGCTLFSEIKETSLFDNNKPPEENSNNNTVKNNNSNVEDNINNKTDSLNDDLNIDPSPNNNSSNDNISNLNNDVVDWFYVPNETHTTPQVNNSLSYDLSTYDAIYNGETNRDSNVLYLTFDEGYENGYTSEILDILKEKNVKAVFFVTSHYIKNNPDLIKRMALEGHIVGNHSETHPSMPTVTHNINKFKEEFSDVESKYKEITGKDITKIFRPPMGAYSEKSLAMTKDLGYKTVFWSFAYHDWDPDDQPKKEYAKDKILSNLHNGSILLLHAVSKTNTEILGEVIDSARNSGYEFKLIN